jgi:hypothetical protein
LVKTLKMIHSLVLSLNLWNFNIDNIFRIFDLIVQLLSYSNYKTLIL